ncbi:hypothetical protein COS31_04595 [Candidatus Roizmanbacteria bacterium CG02_land_8_20_14_3_00_36_15]|uniref:Uncharacterized protein n=1 Tax=Candidatus Roizmanbacteria bacterium CG10_big_fil_rev_8_21_14_0_10_36_26 TaxID=1974851 RepID=A0A2M8KK67_9BACT|nr:MAG: hypothetical protein COS51_02110 [Candidatus Roizmanbacteria bacterium CG03_land_8_20_14_0_80_36_21]PIV37447.1 MAG: hypothetical protein COS31_04595 [Candidatus Roizmanbacteria bacterium CG02_land_8_20_14_3_00_36_15]PIY70522.1 MAG: hypothetical protein COY89_00645 [Candidatus Roizmanbacteria bacterium CG_4_10_14_0_8_um_filter_36_36]PJE60319.1 MAG: hypothetical protein COU86_04770 [Candidatus Roizmanbacteria bacterium CG10_big_fil_rev_8_21_14_0_10_36_26]
MNGKNFTSIDYLLKKSTAAVSLPKEVEPTLLKKVEIKEAVEHEPDREVAPYLQRRAETITLPPDLKKIGLQASTTSRFSGFQNIKLPISDDKVVSGSHAPITSSLRWLATLALYILWQAHLGLKTIHGKVVRVIRR